MKWPLPSASDCSIVAELLQPPQLQRTLRSLKASGAAPSDSAERFAHLAGQLGQAEREGVSGFAARFGKVVESVAEDALGAGESALVLEDAVRDRQVVLFSLDVAGYQDLAVLEHVGRVSFPA